MRRILLNVLILIGLALGSAAGLLYLLPNKISAVAWQAPNNNGFKGVFGNYESLTPVQLIAMNGQHGPEDLAISPDGDVVVPSAQGYLLKLNVTKNQFEPWLYTGGYPLGMRYAANGELWVADARLGLLQVSTSGDISIKANEHANQPFGFVDAVALGGDGTVYFTDASVKFSLRDYRNPDYASHYDILEHGGHGRVYAYHPTTGQTELLSSGIVFANGIAVSHDQTHLLVVETGKYRVLKIDLVGEHRGRVTSLIDNLPGFPDNLSVRPQGGYWLGLIAPRSALLDALDSWPSVRNMIAKLPKSLQPAPEHFSHVVQLNNAGEIVLSVQDPIGSIPLTTGAVEYRDKLYITSLSTPFVAIKSLRPSEEH
ncbi:SMP-30/gluconolactonase/LRE family protein [Alteromonas sp. ASW11-36]|uniref:SMP-30/gluconolactonase/LRE family protein n=1 Tax=Alteromonas arenosi TaxID=3055817 RepID=A0ABT7T0W9_9ALTE|nr:SMP-30/gluconolactonase/LRE family protein [Alteromonas sp. ASW11-36]MDM7862093.1 SMP-30/gluconolactonase/LRE family protein [Alteromonas sp. ASW11-36]